MTLGDATSVVGFHTAGEIHTGANGIVLNDANQAQLGSLTHLGGNGQAGTLIATRGAVVDFGENLTGFGTVFNLNTFPNALINNGVIAGNSLSELIQLNGYVKGVGTFNNVQFNGIFSPGLSPAEVYGGDMYLGDTAVLEMELGGLIRGSEYDALISSGMLSIDGTLSVQLLSGFDPLLGDSFDLLDWSTSFGTFDMLRLPTLNQGLRWDTSGLYSHGTLSVTSVPEPGCAIVLGVLAVGLVMRRKRYSRS